MGEFILNGRNYGGSIITPNPSDTPTDTLDSIKIGDTTYEIQGGGSNLILDAQRYSLDEQVVGIWTDGKPLYQKTINCGALPNNTDKRVQHGIQNVDCFVGVFGIAENPNINSIPIIFSNSGGSGIVTIILEKSSDIIIRCNSDRSTYTKTFVTLQYTKTTDTAGSGGYQAYGFSPIIYSDTEREVGVWRDNKPLYQKTINFGALPNATNKRVNHNIADVEKIWVYDGYALNPTTGFVNQLNVSGTDSINKQWYCGCNTTFVEIVTRNDRTAYSECYITLLYTKTTDVAGSGEYNTLAIPNVHYSTDEQVIGTWIDGKTLYQKTFEVATTTKDDWVVIINDASILIKEYEGKTCFANGNRINVDHFISTNNYGTGLILNNGHQFQAVVYNTVNNMEKYIITLRYTKTT